MKSIHSPFIFIVLFCLSAPLIASAHVQMKPASTPAGGFEKFTFRVLHGCDGSPTTKLTIQIPEGTLSVKPQVHAGWEISMKSRKLPKPATLHGKEVTESVSEVTFSGGSLPDEFMDEFSIDLKVPDSVNVKVYFPVIQECKKGSNRWTEQTDDGKFPAPYIKLEAAKAHGSGHHH